MRQWRPFAWPLAVLAALPLWRAVGWLTPLGPLSELTAGLSRQWLELCGFSVSQSGLFVDLSGGEVKVAKLRLVSDVICNRRNVHLFNEFDALCAERSDHDPLAPTTTQGASMNVPRRK